MLLSLPFGLVEDIVDHLVSCVGGKNQPSITPVVPAKVCGDEVFKLT